MNKSQLPSAWNDGAPDPAGCCRHLRTKMMHVTSDWESRAAEFPSSSASYWCLKTMGVAGPDDAPAVLDDCRFGRSCFEPQD